jgi:uncharacterized membrane protein YoaK (UPF0700 family)
VRNRTAIVLYALTFVTGAVDATCFLALGGVFAAMMTGNVVFLGLGLSDSADSSVLGPAIAIAAYVVASIAASLLARRTTAGRAFGTPVSNAVEVGLLATATIIAAATNLDADGASGYLTLALLAAAMGWRATNVRAVGSVNVPSAVLNLTTIAAPPVPGAGLAEPRDLQARALAFACFLAGAVVGGLLLEIDSWVPLALALAVSLGAAIVLTRTGSDTRLSGA